MIISSRFDEQARRRDQQICDQTKERHYRDEGSLGIRDLSEAGEGSETLFDSPEQDGEGTGKKAGSRSSRRQPK
jgi:hypothetical protein